MESNYDPWKKVIEEMDREIIQGLRDEMNYQMKLRTEKLIKEYNIPQPSQPMTDEELAKYVDDYVATNFVVH